MTLVPQDLPDYVELGGRQVWRPPYTARHAEIFGFVVKANRSSAIDTLLQHALVEPAGGEVDYRCAHDHAMVTFTTIDRLASEDPPDRDRGYITECEVGVWCLAADVAAGERLVWYMPYVFTDSGQTVATGREVYGYAKQIGLFEVDFPDKVAQGGDPAVWALGIDPFGPDSRAVPLRMISTTRRAAQPGEEEDPTIGGSWLPGFTFFEEFMTAFPGEVQTRADLPFGPTPEPSAVITPVDAPPPPRTPPPRPWQRRRLLHTVHGRALTRDPNEMILEMIKNPTLVFLKQFRDVTCATKACYQAVVEAPLAIHVGGASYAPLDPDRFEITIEDWATHPIATDIGVEAGKALKPERVFRASLDFDIMLGQEVWRAT